MAKNITKSRTKVSPAKKSTEKVSKVEREIDNVKFWLSKIKEPEKILLSSAEINTLNRQIIEKDTYRVDVLSINRGFKKEEIKAYLDEEPLPPHGERYDVNGNLLTMENFYSKIIENVDAMDIADQDEVRFAVVYRRANVRTFPVDSYVSRHPGGADDFQMSAIDTGEPVVILHTTKDGNWYFIQAAYYRGWIQKEYVAMVKKREEMDGFINHKPFLIVTANVVSISGQDFHMGSRIPILRSKEDGFIIAIPGRGKDGRFVKKISFLRHSKTVNKGYLPLTRENILKQAFLFLNTPYSWGGKGKGIDCSQFIFEIYRSFGIIMPRNSSQQVKIGRTITDFSEDNRIEKRIEALKDVMGGTTILYFPGHIMLYLGRYSGGDYVIHAVYGIRQKTSTGENLIKINKVVVSKLYNGDEGVGNSLLERIVKIQDIISISP